MDDDISRTIVKRHEAADQGRTTTDTDPGDLARRYISMWNGPEILVLDDDGRIKIDYTFSGS